MQFDAAELDGLMSYRYEQPYTFSVLTFLYPWLRYDQQFHVDHIFPRALFTAKELRKHNTLKRIGLFGSTIIMIWGTYNSFKDP